MNRFKGFTNKKRQADGPEISWASCAGCCYEWSIYFAESILNNPISVKGMVENTGKDRAYVGDQDCKNLGEVSRKSITF